MWKSKGYEAPEWNDATDIMMDMQRHAESMQRRIDKWKAESERLKKVNAELVEALERIYEYPQAYFTGAAADMRKIAYEALEKARKEAGE